MKTKETPEVFGQGAGRALEGFAVWAETGQAILRQAADFAVKAADEGTRLFAALQTAGLEAAKDSQSWTQRLIRDGLDESRKFFGHVTEGGQHVARSAQALQAAGDQAAVEMRAAVSETAAKVADLTSAAKG